MRTIISSQRTSLSFDYENQRKLMKEERFAGKQNSAGEMGHRIAKHSYDKDQAFNNGLGQLVKSTYYVLDAQGNTMATYERAVDENTLQISYVQTEKFIYGSARLGVQNVNIGLLGSQNNAYTQTTVAHRIGKKGYELISHKNDVVSVVSDKVIPHSSNGSAVDYYLADIIQSTDYSGFGVQLSGRDFKKAGAKEFAFGFQGQLEDDEIKGDGNSLNYEYRMHDPRLGRFFAVDPLAAKYPHNGPYNFSENRLIDGIELEGLEVYLINGYLSGQSLPASLGQMKSYWGSHFTQRVSDHFNEPKVVYIDGHLNDFLGSPFSLVQSRVDKGYQETYNKLRNGEMMLSNDVPITIVAHSQGNAYGVGMVQAIIDFQKKYNKNNPDKTQLNVVINFIALAVFQGEYLTDDLIKPDNYENFELIQFTYFNDLYQCRETECGWDANMEDFYARDPETKEKLGALGAHSAVINQDQALDEVFKLDEENKVFEKKGDQ